MEDKVILDNSEPDEFVKEFDGSELMWTQSEIRDENFRKLGFNEKCKKAIIKLNKRKRKMELRAISDKCRVKKERKWNMATTTKKVLLYLIINCTVVEIYSMYVMYKLSDLSALYALIAAVITETVTFLGYLVKSYLETKSEKNHELEIMKVGSGEAPIPESENPEENQDI